MNWYLEVLTNKYAAFGGRARRSEYWYFFLFNIAISLALAIADIVIRSVLGYGMLGPIYSLAVLIPGIAVTIRRLHDTDRSGWWILLGLVPLVGLVLIVFLVQEGTGGRNQYGPDPKTVVA